MKRKPENIKFDKLAERLNRQIKALEEYAEEIKKSKTENPEKKFLNNFSLPEIENEIEVKKQLLAEYMIRAEEGERLKKKETEDYKKNFKKTLKLAKSFKTDISLPKDMRTHLAEVLKFNYSELKTQTEKNLYYQTLRKEVEMCVAYKRRKQK